MGGEGKGIRTDVQQQKGAVVAVENENARFSTSAVGSDWARGGLDVRRGRRGAVEWWFTQRRASGVVGVAAVS